MKLPTKLLLFIVIQYILAGIILFELQILFSGGTAALASILLVGLLALSWYFFVKYQVIPPVSSHAEKKADTGSFPQDLPQSEIDKKLDTLMRLNNTLIGRELQMIEMKKENDALKKRLGESVVEDSANTEEVQREIEFFKRNNATVEETKQALFNVMSDLERNRMMLEQEFIRGKALLESIGEGMIATNEVGKITLVNQSAEEMLGWNMEEIKNKQFEEVIHVEDENNVLLPKEKYPLYISLLTHKKVSNSAPHFLYYNRKDNSKFPVINTVTPVVINGDISGTITIFRNVTKEKEIDKMKTEFISLASHQLRTPLSAVKWFTEMLLEGDAGKLSDKQKELMDNVHTSNERMIQLVNALLNISRIESGRIIIEPQPTRLENLVKEALTEVEIKMKQKNQKLVLSIYDKIPEINIDQKLVREVYINLLTNAVKYTPENGEITVILSKKGESVISQVSDNGYGIPAGEQSKVFQKFFRAGNVVKHVTDGTGLGLYLVKSIIESSGGEIWFKSEEGKGTTFFFSLPIKGSIPKKGDVSLDTGSRQL